MSEYRVTILTDGQVTERFQPFYVKDRAIREAVKQTRIYRGDSIVAEVAWTDLRGQAHVKRYSRGRVLRSPS